MTLTDALDTLLIHAGEPSPRVEGAVVMPIFQSATFEYAGETDYHALRYIRLNNTPNHQALHAKLAALEGAEDALVFSSGMAAISTSFLSLLDSGDHLLVQDCLYGGTHDLVTRDLTRLGISHDFVDPRDPASWSRKLRPRTKLIYVEAMTNPLLDVADHDAVISFAREHRLVSVIDNTFATPVNFRACARGFDLALHSATKYLNGHSDLVAGAAAGSRALIAQVKRKLDHLGGALDPHAAFLLHRGLKTLGVRVRQQNQSALIVAAALATEPGVRRVNHPGLPDHPDHARAARLFTGFGGMLSFELEGDQRAAKAFLARTRLPVKAPSLGGVESLLTLPALTSHAGLDPAVRRGLGISDSLVRMSVGLEDPADLVEDLLQAVAG